MAWLAEATYIVRARVADGRNGVRLRLSEEVHVIDLLISVRVPHMNKLFIPSYKRSAAKTTNKMAVKTIPQF